MKYGYPLTGGMKGQFIVLQNTFFFFIFTIYQNYTLGGGG